MLCRPPSKSVFSSVDFQFAASVRGSKRGWNRNASISRGKGTETRYSGTHRAADTSIIEYVLEQCGAGGAKSGFFTSLSKNPLETAAHHDDEVKSGRNILLVFTGNIARACRYVAPILPFFPPLFFFLSFRPFEMRSRLGVSFARKGIVNFEQA